jgi:hypothetical protein
MLRLPVLMGAILMAAGLSILSTDAKAQSNSNSSSGKMWGTSAIGNSGSDSSAMHSLDGTSAGQVNAAKQGILLYTGPGMTITTIGSQTIVSTTVIGDNNSTNVTATQTSNNSGNVTNSGTISAQ